MEKNNRFVFPPPDSLGYKVSATQLFHGQYGRHQFDIQVVVEADNNELRMVGLAPWGGQLYSIKLSKGKIEYKELDNSRMRINPEYTVTDFILTYWPISVLNNWISKKGLRVTETGSNPVTRTILDEDRPVITINYKNKDKWKGKISFKNIKQDYSFQIETVRVDIQ
ncbi:MAG: DUF3261 domain-containing protein [Gammaproteobacteria bacterium]|nr:DUF3261 domain-containing protein [Gammaproteobacteria bacterium]MDH5592807.1 DUF3261 domain-containing protein [Gammaproteobacteria bacterium]